MLIKVQSATGECLETAVSLNITWWVCLAVVVWGMKGGWRCFVLFFHPLKEDIQLSTAVTE